MADTGTTPEIIILYEGYSTIHNNTMKANCTSTLIKGTPNILVDTMTAWDGLKLIRALEEHGLRPNDIDYVVCTHGHSDHVGCNYLFPMAMHIVGFSISRQDQYCLSPDFKAGEEYIISDHVRVVPTPGHTLQDVSVIVDKQGTIYAITGDLFENENDLNDDNIWMAAGSDSEQLQKRNRADILRISDFIVPGHGKMFRVPEKYKSNL